MAWIRKRGESWYVYFKVDGKLRKKSCAGDRSLAEKLCKAIDKQRAKQRATEFGAPGATPLTGPFLRRCIKLYTPTWAPATVEFYGYAAKALDAFFGDIPLDEITPEQVMEYRGRRLETVKASTVNHETSVLYWAIKRAIEWGAIKTDPLAKLKPRKIRHRARRGVALSAEQKGALLAAAWTPQLRLMIYLALQTGMRHHEITSLRWEAVDLSRRRIALAEAKSDKGLTGGEEQTVPLSVSLVAELTAWKIKSDGRRRLVFPTSGGRENLDFRRQVQRAAAKAKLPRITVHDLRHTALTDLATVTDIRTVQAIARHSDLRMTMRYAHAAHERGLAAVDRLGEGPALAAV